MMKIFEGFLTSVNSFSSAGMVSAHLFAEAAAPFLHQTFLTDSSSPFITGV